MIKAFLIMEITAGVLTLAVCVAIRAAKNRDKWKGERIAEEIERRQAARGELLGRLSAAYKKAKGAGVHNFYLLAVSHCCQLLQNGEEIDEGAALLALRGLEGDESLNATINKMLTERCKSRRGGE